MTPDSAMTDRPMHHGEEVIDAIVDYVTRPLPLGDATRATAVQIIMDAAGCAVGASGDLEARGLLGPLAPGTATPNGARVIGTGDELDPVKAAFDMSLLIRWLDFSDTSTVGGHPSDNLGAVLAVADHMDRRAAAEGGAGLTMADVLEAVVKVYEVHGALADANRFDRPGIGLDHVIVVEIASAAVACWLMGGSAPQIRDAVANAWVDGHSLNCYRHVPNTTSRKGWAGANAASRGVTMAWLALRGATGSKTPLSAPVWGFSEVYLGGEPVRLGPLSTRFADTAIFKLVPVQRNASTAVEAAIRLHPWFSSRAGRIASIAIETQDEAMRRIVKTGPLPNRAARDHCLQYVVAVALLRGELTIGDYSDAAAADPEVERLRDLTAVTEHPSYTRDHHDPAIASCANAITLTTEDGETSPRVEVLYPAGDHRRRAEAMPLLRAKFRQLTRAVWPERKLADIEELFRDPGALAALRAADAITRLI